MTRRPAHRPARRIGRPRAGITPPEVLVVVLVLGLLVLVLLFSLPRQRENARMAGCQRNLMQVGLGLALYERSERALPPVPRLDDPTASISGPIKSVLQALALPDFTELSDLAKPPPSRAGLTPVERALPGLVCQSDPYSSSPRSFPAPISYRACAGDRPTGKDGAFAPGRRWTSRGIEAGDGRSYTAAFSERLLGSPGPLTRYRRVPGPIPGSGCPDDPSASTLADAGSTWFEASWRSSLYNHALNPNAIPSCIAADGLSAMMGASSGHLGGVNVLLLDGGVRTIRPTITPQVWKALATPGEPAANAPGDPPK